MGTFISTFICIFAVEEIEEEFRRGSMVIVVVVVVVDSGMGFLVFLLNCKLCLF